MMLFVRWFSGLCLLAAGAVYVILSPMAVMYKFLSPLLAAGFLCLFRIIRGPTAADRAVASDVLGILVVGVCAIFAVFSDSPWYMDIAIAWALQSFIGILALAKYLEGKNFDD